jgi:hypothetical protein
MVGIDKPLASCKGQRGRFSVQRGSRHALVREAKENVVCAMVEILRTVLCIDETDRDLRCCGDTATILTGGMGVEMFGSCSLHHRLASRFSLLSAGSVFSTQTGHNTNVYSRAVTMSRNHGSSLTDRRGTEAIQYFT